MEHEHWRDLAILSELSPTSQTCAVKKQHEGQATWLRQTWVAVTAGHSTSIYVFLDKNWNSTATTLAHAFTHRAHIWRFKLVQTMSEFSPTLSDADIGRTIATLWAESSLFQLEERWNTCPRLCGCQQPIQEAHHFLLMCHLHPLPSWRGETHFL